MYYYDITYHYSTYVLFNQSSFLLFTHWTFQHWLCLLWIKHVRSLYCLLQSFNDLQTFKNLWSMFLDWIRKSHTSIRNWTSDLLIIKPLPLHHHAIYKYVQTEFSSSEIEKYIELSPLTMYICHSWLTSLLRVYFWKHVKTQMS